MRKILSISLAFLMTLMSLKLTLAVHFCGEEVAETALGFGNPATIGCGMEEDIPCNDFTFNKKSCCKDQLTEIGVDAEYHLVGKLSCLDKNFTLSFSKLPAYVELNYLHLSSHNLFYRPPPDIHNVYLSIIQVFII